jgi:hypothetical protein
MLRDKHYSLFITEQTGYSGRQGCVYQSELELSRPWNPSQKPTYDRIDQMGKSKTRVTLTFLRMLRGSGRRFSQVQD